MRKALIVGIDYYEAIGGLDGCVNDAHELRTVMERHSDGSINFGVKLLTASSSEEAIDRKSLKEEIRQLFADDSEIALLFFAGHGFIEATGGYICASDCKTGDDGLPLSEIQTLANRSGARNKIILLDSCHSGIAGDRAEGEKVAELAQGTTILTASAAEQYAMEANGGGVFTGLLVDALHGAASNLVGDVTPGSVYAHIDQSLGPWAQRPLFKSNVTSFVSLRKVTPPISLDDLRRIADFFPNAGYEFQLDPSFEPESDDPNPENTKTFAILQKYNRVNLVVPVGAPHMYHAAIESKLCRLTVLGEHYRSLVAGAMI